MREPNWKSEETPTILSYYVSAGINMQRAEDAANLLRKLAQTIEELQAKSKPIKRPIGPPIESFVVLDVVVDFYTGEAAFYVKAHAMTQVEIDANSTPATTEHCHQ